MRNGTNKLVAGLVSGLVIGSIGTSYVLPKPEQTASAAGNGAVTAPSSTSFSSSSSKSSSSSTGTQAAPQTGKRGHHQGAANLSDVQSLDVAAGQYKDGTYQGEAVGYAPGLKVQVTIAGGKMTAIKITGHNETPGFYEKAFQVVPQEIIQAQSTKVDTVSRATYSSVGIMNAVNDALADAKA